MAKSDMGPVGGKAGAPTKSEDSMSAGQPKVGFSEPGGQNTAAGAKPGGFGQNPRRPH